MADNELVRITVNVLSNSGQALKLRSTFKDEWIGYRAFGEKQRAKVRVAKQGDVLIVDVPRWVARRLELV